MKQLKRFLKQLTSWSRTGRDEERLREEIEAHISFQTEDNLRAGLSPEEARRQAMLKFGTVEAIKEDYRDQRSVLFIETLLRDTRYALRRLRRSPAFTVTVIFTLALGIGATTAIFTLAHAVLMKSLPVANPGDLYRVGKQPYCCAWGGYTQNKDFSIFSYDLYKYLRDNTEGFAELAAFQAGPSLFGVRRSGRSEAARSYHGEFVSGNYFIMFGINAYAGRMLTPADDRPGAPPVAVMSYRLWQQRYGSDPSVIGGHFNIDEKPFTLVGITPPRFFWRHSAQRSARFLSAAQHRTTCDGRCRPQQDRLALARHDRAYPGRRGPLIHRGSNAGGSQAMAALALGRHERQRSREVP